MPRAVLQRRSGGAFALFSAVLLALLGCGGEEPPACTPLPTECQGPSPSYASDVAPIFAQRCAGAGCHDGKPGNQWAFESYEHVKSWDTAILVQLRTCGMPPPDPGKTLPEAERQTMNAWLICGAQDN